MFGINEIVGKQFFKDAKEGELLVTSRFFTLQGEGPYRGHPAYFIRLAK
jgi:7-carboxy-7-deazaguanine synthase